jgi:hypothetical protein
MVGCYQRFGGRIFSPEDGSSLFCRNAGTNLPDQNIMMLKLFILELYLLDCPVTRIRMCHFETWQESASKYEGWYRAIRKAEEVCCSKGCR